MTDTELESRDRRAKTPGETRDPAFENLLLYLKRSRGFDFTGYKRSSLMRRVRKRMITLNLEDFDGYQDYLEVHPNEFELLFNIILINFTGFFRDLEAWDYLAAETVPRILESLPDSAPIRVWSAGCASGEEAYTVAMVLAEAMGIEACRERVKIYATDVDEAVLAQARTAVYSERALEGVSPHLREIYFEPSNGDYVFRNDLRRILVFGRHDLVQDAPISRLDLLICRNTLIYFNREVQKRIISSFHFALKPSGFLFLGRAEMLLAQDNLFVPDSIKHRIFTRVNGGKLRDQFRLFGQQEPEPPPALDPVVWQMALDTAPVAQVVLDAQHTVLMFNSRAQSIFGLLPCDKGRPFKDLELSYRPVELRSVLERVEASGVSVRLEDIEWNGNSEQMQYFDVEVSPLRAPDGVSLGLLLVFIDVTQRTMLRRDVEQARQVAETANEELLSTNEELETSNEELQSTVEELQTTNEEMETVNEELQSANEELQAMNQELRERTTEADLANLFLESILTSVDVGIVVINRDHRILLWNDHAEDLWGLRAEEVRGRSLLDLDIGLPVDELDEPLQRLWNQPENAKREIMLNARNRRGREVRLRLTMSVRISDSASAPGMVLLMQEAGAP